MNEQEYELLSRYLDGELPAAEARELRERLLAEPQLRAELDRMKAVNARLVATFGSDEAGQVPERISALLQAPRRDHRRAGWGFAVAASLLAGTGLLLGPQLGQFAGNDDSREALLAGALEDTHSSADSWLDLADGSRFRAVLSFASDNGDWCREYLLAAPEQTLRGVSCRRDGTWSTVVEEADNGLYSTSAYRPAGASQADNVAAYIELHAADIPLSRSQEARLIASDWH